MKSLVIYYSLTGNVKLIAETIALKIQADLLEIKPKEDIPDKGFMKFVWGGKQVFTQHKPELLPFTFNPDYYDMLFIGTPVWAWSYAPALRTFFEQCPIKNKKIALFCCHGGGKGKTLERMQEALVGNQFLSAIDFKEPLKHDIQRETERASNWATEIIQS